MGGSGGLVEIDDQGGLVRSASSADPAFPDALLTPYSLVLPELMSTFNQLLHGRAESLQRRNLSGMAAVGPEVAEDGLPRCGQESLWPH